MSALEVRLSRLLTEAKEAHTRWEAQFTSQASPIPPHTWEDWYARFIVQRLNEGANAESAAREAEAYAQLPNTEWGWIA